jgi:predicted AAA+ superfamily ATPase
MRKIIRRLLDLDLPEGKSAFLWGPRKVGKSYWLSHEYPEATTLDFLETDTFAEYVSKPSLLRERYSDHKGLLVIDEVQKVPQLLDEVHWLIEKKGLSFLLTGSSARKLKRGHANLLGGRAWRREMRPLSYVETEGFVLSDVLRSGLLPSHFLSDSPIEELRSYVSDYLKEEIAAEALTQNIPAFSTFLRVSAMTSSELINYVNIAQEVGVSHKVVRTYFDILEDTLLGFRVQPWTKSLSRRLVKTEKFYLFDVGVATYLARRSPEPGTPDFGKAFEHFIVMELKAFQAYKDPDIDISFWRTSSGQEVDFILGDKQLVIEVKASSAVRDSQLSHMKALMDEGHVKHAVIVSLEKIPRKVGGIHILPWEVFLQMLWAREFV